MSRSAVAWWIVFPILLGVPASRLGAQTAELVRDINTSFNPARQAAASSDPGDFLAWQGKLFFAATQPASGREPWMTDGTAAGTQLLADVCSGECSSNPQFFGGVGGLVFFGASTNEPFAGSQPWRTDGTRAGTFPLTDLTVQLAPPSFQPQPSSPAVVAGARLFFLGCETAEASICTLWSSDGTPGGTRPVPGLGGTTFVASNPVPAGGKVYLLAGNQIWVTDGTAAGTLPLSGGPNADTVEGIFPAGDRVFFTAFTSATADQIWVVGPFGTEARQVPLPGSLSPHPSLTIVGNRAYFVLPDAAQVPQLWVTDGTRAETAQVTFFAANQVAFRDSVAEVGGRTLFQAADLSTNQLELWVSAGAPGTTAKLAASANTPLLTLGSRVLYATPADGPTLKLWATDGTAAGSRLLTGGFCLNNCSGQPGGITVVDGAAFFAAPDGGGFQFELWRTDGTPAGTRRFTDLAGSLPNFDPTMLASLSGALYFAAAGPYGRQLWRSNGAAGGTVMVADIARTEDSANPAALTPFGGQLLFSVFDGTSRKLWQSAGTAASTSAVSALPLPAPPGTDFLMVGPQFPVVAGDTMFFWLPDSPAFGLWRSDGTAAGTFLLHEFMSPSNGPFDLPTLPPAPLGSRVFFSAPGAGGGSSLWVSDGTIAGTADLVDFPALATPLASLTAAGGQLYFAGRTTDGKGQLYGSDGTAAGTTLLLEGNFQPDDAMQFTAFGPAALFILSRDPATRELWRTDGTAAGTTFVASLFAGGIDPVPTDLVPFDGALFFFANTGNGRALFRSDGTPQGTAQVLTVEPNNLVPLPFPVVTRAAGLTVFANALYFAADDGVHGRELWRSDGTAARTALFLDILPGPLAGSPGWLTAAGGRLWFSADDGVHGFELWQSDGTVAGTRMVQDITPGADSSYPDQLTVAGNLLYFTADDGAFGRQLWAIPLGPAASGCQPTSTRLCVSGNRFQIEVVWRDFQGNEGAGIAVPLTADTGTFWFFTASNVEVIVKVLDGRSLNQSFWVFYGALSDVEYTITVTDTATGLTRQYFNPAGQLASVGDTMAFGPLGEFSAPPEEARRAARSVAAATARAARASAGRGSPTAAGRAGRTAPAGAPCQTGPTRLCLNNGRFAVDAAWQDFQGRTGTGAAVPLSGDTGYFWFFGPDNVEVVLKVIDGRAVNGKFWVFYGALSSVQYTLTVTDTVTGQVRIYQNPSGQLASVADTGAF